MPFLPPGYPSIFHITWSPLGPFGLYLGEPPYPPFPQGRSVTGETLSGASGKGPQVPYQPWDFRLWSQRLWLHGMGWNSCQVSSTSHTCGSSLTSTVASSSIKHSPQPLACGLFAVYSHRYCKLLSKEKLLMTVIEDSKKTVGTAAMGFCSGREIGPNSEYRTGKGNV